MPIYIGYVATSIRCQGRSLKCKIATLTSVVALAVSFMNPVTHTELTWQHFRYIIQETLAHDLNITGIRVILTIPFANQHESRRLLISNFPWSIGNISIKTCLCHICWWLGSWVAKTSAGMQLATSIQYKVIAHEKGQVWKSVRSGLSAQSQCHL